MTSARPLSLSVKTVMLDEEDRMLLLKRSMDSGSNPGKWDLPGGKLEAGENAKEALLREVVEETGLTISIGDVAGTAHREAPSRRIIYLIFEGRVQSGEMQLSDEHDEYVWVSLNDLPAIDLVPQFREFVNEYCLKTR